LVVSTTNLYEYDSKHRIWKLLKDEFDALESLYPDKINIKVVKMYPKTVEELDKYLATVTVNRITAPQEMLFVGDSLTSGINSSTDLWETTKGVLNTDYFEICVWSTDPDYRDQIYYVIRQILLEKRKDLLKEGYTKFVRTGGGDQEVELVGIPRIVYRGIHIYMIQSTMTKDDIYGLVSQIEVTQTTRQNINSESNETVETSIVPD